jgi:hypothetical protein
MAWGGTVMKLTTTLASALLISAFSGTGFAADGDHGDRGSLAGQVFYIEATIVSSPIFTEYEGAVFPSCFTFEEDGTWIDLEWPGEGLPPIPGVWIAHTEFPFVQFTSFARYPAAGWTLVEYGLVAPGGQQNQQRMNTYGMVFTETNELVFYVTTKGHAVETCPL